MSKHRPNVILIISDQHRWDFMEYEDNGTTYTPNLKEIGEGGIIFRHAVCNSPLCSPSRAALATGRYAMNSGCFTNLHEPPPGSPSFVSQLRDAGYDTIVMGKTHMEIHAYTSDLCGKPHQEFMESLGWTELCETAGFGMACHGINDFYTEFMKEQGQYKEMIEFYNSWGYFMDKSRKADHPFTCHEWPLAEELHETGFITDRAVQRIRKADPDKPFFMHVGIVEPHSPINPGKEYLDLYRNQAEPDPIAAAGIPDFMPDGRRGYRAMISRIDACAGRIREALQEKGLLENTIIIYTSDHGEMAGDHGYTDKTCFYEGALRIPLLMTGPGIRAGTDSAAFVELIDLGRTINELCGIQPHSLDQGESLACLLKGETEVHRNTLYCEMGCDRMLQDEHYKLMYGDPKTDLRELGRLHLNKPVTVPRSPVKLFDMQEDPEERYNLADDPANTDLLLAMTEKLLAHINANIQMQPFKDRGPYKRVEV